MQQSAQLAFLKKGNQSFIDKNPEGYDHSIRQELADGQQPSVAVVACADSRVPVETLFDAKLGELFVVRVAGNVMTSEAIGSLEYAVAVLGVKQIIVLGHSSCGAVGAALNRSDQETPSIHTLLNQIEPHIIDSKDMDQAVTTNAQSQAAALQSKSELISNAIANGDLQITSGVYQLSSGAVTFHDS